MRRPIYKEWWFWIIVVMLVGVAGYGIGRSVSETKSREALTPIVTAIDAQTPVETVQTDPESPVNYGNFLNIEMGSTYADVVKLVGEGSEMTSSEIAGFKTVVYTWKTGLLRYMSVTIQGDAVVGKTQLGLLKADDKITLEMYNQTKEGMTYEEVKAVLGGGQLIAQTEIMGIGSMTYHWINGNVSNATLTFVKDILMMKVQISLK